MNSVFSKHKLLFCAVIILTVLMEASAVIVAWIDVAWVNFVIQETEPLLANLIVFTVLVVLGRAVIMYFWGVVWFDYPAKSVSGLKSAMMETLLKFKTNIFKKSNSEIVSILTNDFFQLYRRVFGGMFHFIAHASQFMIAVIVLTVVDLRLLLAVIIISCFPVLIGLKIQKTAQNLQKKFNEENAVITERIKETLGGLKLIKRHLAKDSFYNSSCDSSTKLERAKLAYRNMDVYISEIASFFSQLVFFSVVLISGWLVSTGQITVAAILLIFAFSIRIENGIAAAIPSWVSLRSIKPTAERILSLINDRKIYDGEKLNGEIEEVTLKDISVSFNDKAALDGFSYSFLKGKKYLIIGESGCGKSTLLQVLSKRNEDFNGNIMVRSQNISAIDYNEWNKKVSYITQNVFMLNKSGYDNIKFEDDFSNDNQALWAAISGASLQNVNLGKNANQISGGERQRIALARALLRKQEMLLLDEINAELDNITSKEILKTITSLPFTVICVMHRFDEDMLMLFDSVILMDRGKIKQSGSPENFKEHTASS